MIWLSLARSRAEWFPRSSEGSVSFRNVEESIQTEIESLSSLAKPKLWNYFLRKKLSQVKPTWPRYFAAFVRVATAWEKRPCCGDLVYGQNKRVAPMESNCTNLLARSWKILWSGWMDYKISTQPELRLLIGRESLPCFKKNTRRDVWQGSKAAWSPPK